VSELGGACLAGSGDTDVFRLVGAVVDLGWPPAEQVAPPVVRRAAPAVACLVAGVLFQAPVAFGDELVDQDRDLPALTAVLPRDPQVGFAVPLLRQGVHGPVVRVLGEYPALQGADPAEA
jgi:hypothetical protein